jgi:TraX protein
MTIKKFSSTINSYDLLKTFAVLTMVIDHIGANFYPDDFWWRVVGRMSVPIWIFLIGYAKTRDLSSPLWIGTFILLMTNMVVGQAALPLCIFATILACRCVIDPVMDYIKTNRNSLYPIVFIAAVLSVPSAVIIDYGVGIFLFAMLGYMVRREGQDFSKGDILQFALVVGFVHAALQVVVFFPFDAHQKIFAAMGILGVTMGLIRFSPRDYPRLEAKSPQWISLVLKVCGRKSLEIYVVHLVLFKFMALLLGVSGFAFLNFHIL